MVLRIPTSPSAWAPARDVQIKLVRKNHRFHTRHTPEIDAVEKLINWPKTVKFLDMAGIIMDCSLYAIPGGTPRQRFDMDKSELLSEILALRMRLSTARDQGLVPSAGELEKRYSVSHVTALKALRNLETMGLVASEGPGKRRRRLDADSMVSGEEDLRPSSPYLRVAEVLKREIQMGLYAAGGRLPPLKALAERLHAAPATVSKALTVLEREGMLKRRGRRVQVEFGLGKPAKGYIWLAGLERLILSQQHFHLSLLKGLEQGLENGGLGRLCSFMVTSPSARNAPPDHEVRGYVHVTSGPEEAWNRFFESKSRVPLAVIDISEQSQIPIKRGLMRMLRPDNRRAGREAALFLQSLGHENVAFFTHVPDRVAWASLRLEGLREIFTQRGKNGVRFYQALPERRPAFASSPRPSLDGWLPEIFLRRYFSLQAELELTTAAGKALWPMFEDAWKDRKQVRAWVCVNDQVALLALGFLQQKGVRPPHPVSLLGFDDLPFTYAMGLTTYDFCFERFGHLAAEFLGEGRLGAGNQAVLRVPGRLVVRDST